jgi:hypothetical protein
MHFCEAFTLDLPMSKTQGRQLTLSDVVRRMLSTAIESPSNHALALLPLLLRRATSCPSASATWLAATDLATNIINHEATAGARTLHAVCVFGIRRNASTLN